MTDKEIIYLMETFPKYRGLNMDEEAIDVYLEVERILLGNKVARTLSCQCHSNYLVQFVEQLYKINEPNIKSRYENFNKKMFKMPKT